MSNPIGSASGIQGINQGNDRRAAARIHVSWAAKLRLPDALALVPGKVADASIGGVSFVSAHALKAGAHCTLLIDVAASTGISASQASIPVTVLNSLPLQDGSRQHRANLRFGALPANFKAMLEGLLRKTGG